jgi:hypothetical protein
MKRYFYIGALCFLAAACSDGRNESTSSTTVHDHAHSQQQENIDHIADEATLQRRMDSLVHQDTLGTGTYAEGQSPTRSSAVHGDVDRGLMNRPNHNSQAGSNYNQGPALRQGQPETGMGAGQGQVQGQGEGQGDKAAKATQTQQPDPQGRTQQREDAGKTRHGQEKSRDGQTPDPRLDDYNR